MINRLLWLIITSLSLIVLWLYQRVMTPIKRLSAQAQKLSDGELSALESPTNGISEIESLRKSMSAMVGHVRRAQEGHRNYIDSLTNAQEAERARIARELHDETVQSLISIAQGIELANTWIETDPQKAQAMLKTTRENAVEAANSVRQIIGNLRPPALEELGLIPALNMLKTDIETHITSEGVSRRLEPSHELTLFRAAQEAITNAQRHSNATRIDIEVNYLPHKINLTIHDNGQGFTPSTGETYPYEQWITDGHYGLAGIHERVKLLDGSMHLHSTPSEGTTLNIEIPTEAAPQPESIVIDPVCKAQIKPQGAYGHVEYHGERYYFCCPVCQGAFQRSPEAYLN